MTNYFTYAIEKTLKHEGGYVNNPNDSGGETHWGITKRSYPDLDIKNLTRDQAIEIYRRDFWRPIYNKITGISVAAKVFDMAVNMGHVSAHRCVQRACVQNGCNVATDGAFGGGTLFAVNSIEVNRLIRDIKLNAVMHYYDLAKRRPKDRAFLLGWIGRALSD